MDAPPARENSEPFVRIAQLLAREGLNVPQILAQDLAQGFLLLSDLGGQTFLNVICDDNADLLFADAIDALLTLQKIRPPDDFPVYDSALLQRELSLFPDWYVRHVLGRTLSAAQSASWQHICQLLLASALNQPQVLVHRDYMPRNLMVSTPCPGVLDFQDAVLGPVTYDPVCLFKDAFVSWPQAKIEGWIKGYRSRALALGIALPDDFRRALDWMGVQRHLKVLGIFARICHRDGKPHYLEDAPRFVRYIRDVVARYRELEALGTLFDELGMHRTT